jgi:hypothetical protein
MQSNDALSDYVNLLQEKNKTLEDENQRLIEEVKNTK